MSDTFDHTMDAFEQYMNGDWDTSSNIDSLYYHRRYTGTSIIRQTDKAF